MSYKIKNGAVWLLHDDKWYLETVFTMLYPDVKIQNLTQFGG